MATNFAILRVKKLKTVRDVSRAGNHNMRCHENAARNADPERTHLNRTLIGTTQVLGDVLERYEEIGKKPRKNGVLATEMVLSFSPEAIPPEGKKLDEWVKANKKFVSRLVGEENIINMTLHLDETTPHLHVILVPVHTATKKGKPSVSHKHYFGDPQREKGKKHVSKLALLQTKYAAAMAPFGLSRGVKDSKAVHQSTKDFRREQARELERIKREHKELAEEATKARKEAVSWLSPRSVVEAMKQRYNDFIDNIMKRLKNLTLTNKALEKERDRLQLQLDAAVKLQEEGIDIVDAAEAVKEARAEQERLRMTEDNLRRNQELLIAKSVSEATQEKNAENAALKERNNQLEAALQRSGKTLDIK